MGSAILENHLKKNSRKEKYYEVNPDIKKVANEQLDYWLGEIVSEIQKKKEPGSVCPPNTLYQMCSGLKWLLRDNGRPGLNVFEGPTLNIFKIAWMPKGSSLRTSE